jgi:hypothetical protein
MADLTPVISSFMGVDELTSSLTASGSPSLPICFWRRNPESGMLLDSDN